MKAILTLINNPEAFMFSDNLLFPTDLLDRHYNVKLPDMKKALSMFGITNANISYSIGPVVITYYIKLEFDRLEKEVSIKFLIRQNGLKY